MKQRRNRPQPEAPHLNRPILEFHRQYIVTARLESASIYSKEVVSSHSSKVEPAPELFAKLKRAPRISAARQSLLVRPSGMVRPTGY
jgi:hypothetical protein